MTTTLEDQRFVIGIDLGTTNCAVAYVDLAEEETHDRGIRIFKIPQLSGPGQVDPLPLLPSFLYIPGEYDVAGDAIVRLWSAEQEAHVVGTFARDQGALVPDRLVSSAKSWLCHSNADRRAPILPWGAAEQVAKISPVATTAAYLKHIRLAWNAAWGPEEEQRLENQIVVLTVPASFDEVARELTLEAAETAGIRTAILLEEPLAAFYSWLMRHEMNWRDFVQPGELILVCDIGGGTTDFTLILLKEVDGSPRFERIAVGDHLILGGDNIDLAIAHRVESQFAGQKRAMSTDAWKSLCHQCRQGKEAILGGSADKFNVTLMGGGGRLIADTRRAELTEALITRTVLDGFFPTAVDKPLPSAGERKGITEFGLPYEPEPAITWHMKSFIEKHMDEVETKLQRGSARPDLILYNGGSLKPAVIRRRIRSALQQWYHDSDAERPGILESHDLDLAVAFGAAYYGLVKIGHGVRVGSGSPRSYYIGVARDENGLSAEAPREVMCIVERGLDEGSTIELADRSFEMLTNQPVAFDIYSSSYRSGDSHGDLITVDDSLTALPPLQTVIQYGKKGTQRALPIEIEAEYTEVGTLGIWCRSRVSDHRWKLQFQLRDMATPKEAPQTQVLEQALVEETQQYVRRVLTGNDRNQIPPLVKNMARITDLPRDDWPLGFIRTLADDLLELASIRSKGQDFESGWMNLLGFCLRPGIGEGADKLRMQQIWKIFLQGPVFDRKPRVRLEWWIMWRRVAAGLTEGQQRHAFQSLSSLFFDRKKSSIKATPQERLEIWMFTANLEKLSPSEKTRLGRQLLEDVAINNLKSQHLWALSRLAARDLLYATVDRTIAPEETCRWIERLMAYKGKDLHSVGRTIAQMARKTGDRARDIEDAMRTRVLDWLAEQQLADDVKRPVSEIVPLEARDQNAMFGESLPLGIILRD